MSTSKKITNNSKKVDVSTKSAKHKLSFISIMLITVGTCIGAGIFYKNSSILNNNEGDLYLSIFSWVIAIVGILAMAYTLNDLYCGSKKYETLGFVGWVRVFNGEALYKGLKNFMVLIYLSTNFFFMPYYAVQSLQDASGFFTGNSEFPIWVIILVAFIIMLWFTIIPTFSLKYGNVQNSATLFIKFIPVVFIVIVGIIISFPNAGASVSSITNVQENDAPSTFIRTCMGFGVIASIPAIFFAFDGFYSAAGLVEEAKKPEKNPLALALGLSIVSAVYVILSIVFLVSGTGSIFGFANFYDNKAWSITLGIVSICICISACGVINGIAIYGISFCKDLLSRNDAPFKKFFKFFWRKKNGFAGFYTLTIYFVSFTIFSLIGLFYIPNGIYDIYGSGASRLYSLCDIISNWTALFAFISIGLAILSCLINKKTKRIVYKTPKQRKWLFITSAIISVTIIFISTIYLYVECFYNFFSFLITYLNGTDINNFFDDYLLPQIITLILLIVFTMCIFGPFLLQGTKKIAKKLFLR
ncbi:MAG: APC family permease [Mycoplasmataceae bacterium]|nr:APC family permease [Mycoplasmataceae bacterium]